MTKVPKYWNKAKRYLSKKDKLMSRLIKNYKVHQKQFLHLEKIYFFHYAKVL